MIIPYTDKPNVQHKYNLTLYTDYEHVFEKIDPSLVRAPCVQCDNTEYMPKIIAKLAELERKSALLRAREEEVKSRVRAATRSWISAAEASLQRCSRRSRRRRAPGCRRIRPQWARTQ